MAFYTISKLVSTEVSTLPIHTMIWLVSKIFLDYHQLNQTERDMFIISSSP